MERITSQELARRLYAEELDRTGTTNVALANKAFNGKIEVGIKCTYCEMYALDGQKVYSFNKGDKANSGQTAPGAANRMFLFVLTGISHKIVQPFGRRPQMMYEVMLTKNGFNYLCDKIERSKFPEGYTTLVPLLFKQTANGWVRNPRDVRFYVPISSVIFFSEELAVMRKANNAPVVNIYKK